MCEENVVEQEVERKRETWKTLGTNVESEDAMQSTAITSDQREEDFTYELPKKSGCKIKY